MIYCPEIFHGLYIKPKNNDHIQVSPCCQSKTMVENNDEFSFESSNHLNNIRVDNLNNIKSDACRRCWEAETNGLQSKRESSNNFYNNEIDTSTKIHTLEYNTTWACNLACIMCNPSDSSTWANELGINKDIKEEVIGGKSNTILDTLDLSSIRRVHFNGGEPLINSTHLDVLKKIPTLERCKISYNTNGTKLPNDEVIEYWSKCDIVRIFFSIDAIGDAFDYIRWNAKWDDVKEKLQWFVDNMPSNVMFGINTTVGVYNLLEIGDIYKWYKDNFYTNNEGDMTDFNWQVAYNFNFDYASNEVKMVALNELKSNSILPSLQTAIQNSLNEAQDDKWIGELEIIDKRRGINWKESLRIGDYY